MGSRNRAVVIAILSVALFLLLSLSLLLSEPPKHFLNYSEDKYKIAFASGNLTAAVTKDMPRVVFGHANPVLSPEFEVSSQKLYLFNDSNKDGLFSRSEAIYTSYLDSHHVAWDISKVEFGNDPGGIEYAQVLMRAHASLYSGSDEVSALPAISDWAVVSFSYRITNRATNHTNALGQYTVDGVTEMTTSVTIAMSKHIDADGFVVEKYVHGGGSTNLLLLREKTGTGGIKLMNVSTGLDESVLGGNFTHKFAMTDRPTQDIYISKEDGVVQAFYHFSSVPTNGSGAGAGGIRMNSSYYTDGAGLVLDQAFFVGKAGDSIHQESSLGIDESGFNMKVKDWFQDHLAMLMVVGGTIATVILLAAFAIMYKRYKRSQSDESSESSQKPKSI